MTRMTGRQTLGSRVLLASICIYMCIVRPRKSDERFADILVDCKFFLQSLVASYRVRWQLRLEFYSLITVVAHLRHTFAIVTVKGLQNVRVCVCVCVFARARACMCTYVYALCMASTRVEIVAGGKKSEVDTDHA